MGGGGGGNTTTTQKADPWIGVQPYLKDAYGQLSNLYNQGQDPRYFPSSTVATPDGMEAFGQQMLINAAPGMQQVGQNAATNLGAMGQTADLGAWRGLYYGEDAYRGMQGLADQTAGGAGGATSAMNQLAGYGPGATQAGTAGTTNAMGQLAQAGDFQNNPAFQQALQSAIRPVTQNFQEQVMPAIQQGAQAAGQMGGSRQGIAEGIAARGYQDTIGDISANMGNAAYAQGLQALQASGQLGQGLAGMGLGATGQAGQLGQGLAGLSGQMQQATGALGSSMYGQGVTGLGQSAALASGVQQGLTLPGQVIQGIGQQKTEDAQAQLSDQVARWNYEQNLPYTMLQDYLTQLQGGASLGGTQTARQSGGGSSRATGALGGAATGAAIGSAFGPVGTGIGAAGGALYGLFM